MTVEKALLRVMTDKSNLDQYLKALNPKLLSQESLFLLKEYQGFFAERQTDKFDFGAFNEYLWIQRYPNMDERQALRYKELMSEVQNISLDGKSCQQIIISFEQQEFYARLHETLDTNVDIDKLHSEVQSFKDKLSQLAGHTDSQEWDFTKISQTLDRSGGLMWRLQSLNDHFGGGVKLGDMIIIAGYSDSGKTSFVADQGSHMAEQCQEGETVLWFNTEGTADQVRGRIVCAALSCTSKNIVQEPDKAMAKFLKLMGNDLNRIKVIDAHRLNNNQIEKIILKYKTRLVILDLLDNIHGFENYVGKDGNSTGRYDMLYQWARVVGSTISPVIVISQTNGDGNDNMYPQMTALKGSRVDKQGAATAMLFLGSLQGNDTVRYLSTPKNKIGGGKGFRRQVKFDPLRSRFSDG